MCVLYFFFFQAEDGIRDIGVTGVQTCALPIYSELMVKEQCLWDVAIQMNSSIDSTNVQAANLKPLIYYCSIYIGNKLCHLYRE